VSTQSRGRHIPKEVTSKLLEDARYRCCLCRVLIAPQGFDADALFSSLERHHILLFSDGGGHTCDDLLLVCANCHTQVHKYPDKYPVDELRRKKLHWVGMKHVVSSELRMVDGTDSAIQVTFSVESLNLQYSISVSPETTISQLAPFVQDEILKPLGEYDNNDHWLHPGEVTLALWSAPNESLDPSLSLNEIQLAPDDVLLVLVAKISARVVPGIIQVREPKLVRIPAGRFWMDTNRWDLERAGIKWENWFERQTPCDWVYLPAYAIGKYPVTNAEFVCFIEDGGYANPAYWTEDGWQKKERWNWAKPYYWEDNQWNAPSQPVVGVSWHEAVAYCRWLKIRAGRDYRLPSEAEWEKAARGTDGRIYPWGDDPPDESRCNFGSSVGCTTPVGRYSPRGDSPYGCADMAGNVWEWTSSLFQYYPYWADDGQEDMASPGSRVVRGGSFYSGQWSVRCASRFRRNPDNRLWNDGFRVVVAARQQQSEERPLRVSQPQEPEQP